MSVAKYYDTVSGTWKPIITGPIGPTGATGATGATGGTGATGATGSTPTSIYNVTIAPTSGVRMGDQWLDPNTGNLFTYYTDANTSQWIQMASGLSGSTDIRGRVGSLETRATSIESVNTTQDGRLTSLETADSTTNKSGLVPIIPTSVAVGSGTASVSSSGVVTFTGASTVLLNGVFSSTYKNYKIFASFPSATNAYVTNQLQMRFSTAGTVNSTSNYTWTGFYTQSGTSGNNGGTGTAQSYGVLNFTADAEWTVYGPFDSSRGTEVAVLSIYAHTAVLGEAGYNAAASFDGIQLLGNTYTGALQVYGLRN
jgi:hypothetical protein